MPAYVLLTLILIFVPRSTGSVTKHPSAPCSVPGCWETYQDLRTEILSAVHVEFAANRDRATLCAWSPKSPIEALNRLNPASCLLMSAGLACDAPASARAAPRVFWVSCILREIC